MTGRQFSRFQLWRARLQTLSAREIASVLAAALMVVVVCLLTLGQGFNVGAHLWRSGWLCGETLKGGPFCLPAVKGDPKG